MNIPIELFFGFIGISIVLIIIGMCRDPKVPACIVFAGMFMLTWVVLTDNIDMGSIPTSSVVSGSTTQYNFVPDLFEFSQWPKVIFSLFSVTMMLVGGLMTKSGIS